MKAVVWVAPKVCLLVIKQRWGPPSLVAFLGNCCGWQLFKTNMEGERSQAPHLLLKILLVSKVCFRALLIVPEYKISQSEMSPVTLISTEVSPVERLECLLYFDFPQFLPNL